MSRYIEKLIFLKVVMCIIIVNFIRCDDDGTLKSTRSLPNFRKRVEEIPFENSLKTDSDDSNHNLVSFLVDNVKQIFTDIEEPTILLEPDMNTENNDPSELTTIDLRPPLASIVTEDKGITDKNIEDESTAKNETLTSFYSENLTSVRSIINETEKRYLTQLNLSKEYFIEKSQHEIKDMQMFDSIGSAVADNELSRRSCISCNNILSVQCNDPKNKLISSTICKRDDDLCYSLHTPFGIVNRGCFNVKYNPTTYVCSCNFCNYISISEMPHIFPTKRNWIENVIELSRTKNFRKSIFKDMSCLRCEVNATVTKDLVNDCLEGNIGKLPIEECAENEICGVKAIKSEGYIWRGCLTSHLYNYWWVFCDSDLCNYDRLVSIYEEIL